MVCPSCNIEMESSTMEMWDKDGSPILVKIWYCKLCGRVEKRKL